MSLQVREIPLGGELRPFLDVVDYIYRDDRQFVRALDQDLKDRLSKKNPFFGHAEGTCFAAFRNGKCVGRITAQIDRSHLDRYKDEAGFFGFLDTIDDIEVCKPLLDTAAIREDDARGRHTTTRRQLVRLADGLLIDTPGLRELGVMDAEGVSTAFDDVEGLAASCRFNDCQHRSEPGCAIREALRDGSLASERFDAYTKLQREAHRAVLATDAIARRAERKRWNVIHRSVDQHMRLKYGAER